ncbi:MAG: hypothetical protein J4F49_00395 [Rhodobacteraceae bacterium]|nr:hypothetical protein [Paracoccaceae bacterium]
MSAFPKTWIFAVPRFATIFGHVEESAEATAAINTLLPMPVKLDHPASSGLICMGSLNWRS